jgi:nicotinate-nucleotide adenylyltransferase
LRIHLIVGADIEPELPAWYGAEELLRTVPRIVVGRGGFVGGSPVAMPELSSTEVRRRLIAGQSLDGLLPKSVADYIREHRLYVE